jgi:hypothetical protein
MASVSHAVSKIIIAPTGNLIIELVEFEPARPSSFRDSDDEQVATTSLSGVVSDAPRNIRAVTTFLVDRSILVKCNASSAANHRNVFAVMLDGGFREANQTNITLKGDNTSTMATFFRVIHDVDDEDTFSVGHEVTWHIAKICDKYNISITLFEKWFTRWYLKKGTAINNISANELLFPCWQFNYAAGFLKATRKCVYEMSGHITEENPTEHSELHMPQRIIGKSTTSRSSLSAFTYAKVGQLNAAKGRLRTILHRELFKPVKAFYNASCRCRMLTEYMYHQALYRTRAWPLDDSWTSKSPNVVLDRLDNFHVRLLHSNCELCSQDYEASVMAAKRKTQTYFDGLCLDCMDASKSKTRNQDTDYWMHNAFRGCESSSGCRVRHGEPTWYFSFMGRRTRKGVGPGF